ncbi:MAG: hypothetical protein P4M15_12495 [Alphaproteobacteria bacterium]|nr:hypothetical protein [Alphaproteobacteria bacterium]
MISGNVRAGDAQSTGRGGVRACLKGSQGIAIGPILFIIAILAILAAAIAAGSGSFTAGTTTESDRTKSSALIQIGENLKLGMDRVVNEQSIIPAQVDINSLNLSATNSLFSPNGGAITAPSTSMANAPGSDQWYYVRGPINGLGTSADETFAVIRVSNGVCSEVNNRATGTAAVPTAIELGDFTSGVTTSGQTIDNWPYPTRTVGCVNNLDNNSTGTYFYQVLAIQ